MEYAYSGMRQQVAAFRVLCPPGPLRRPKDATVFDAIPCSIYVLIETFDDFKEEGSLMIPHSYKVRNSLEGKFLYRQLDRRHKPAQLQRKHPSAVVQGA